FERVRRQRLNRLVQLRDMPGAIAERVFMRLLYGDAPYGHTPLGREASLKALTLDDLRDFHRTFRPADGSLGAGGGGGRGGIHRLAESVFGGWAAGQGPMSADELPLPQPARLNIIARPEAPQSELRIGHVAVSRSTPDYHALVAANMVLGGQFVSRVNLNL